MKKFITNIGRYIRLSHFDAKNLVASLVSISLARELAPVFTALVVAGKISSVFTLEISKIKINQQMGP